MITAVFGLFCRASSFFDHIYMDDAAVLYNFKRDDYKEKSAGSIVHCYWSSMRGSVAR